MSKNSISDNLKTAIQASLNAGKAIASQQMGNNKGATQAGGTGSGLGRQIDHLGHNKLR